MPSLSASSIAAEAAIASQPTPPIRLLLLTDTALTNTGGSERFLRNLVGRLPPERYAITVIQLGADNAPGETAHVTEAGTSLRVLNHPIGPIYGPRGLRAILDLRARLRLESFDIIQSQHEKSDLINLLLGPRQMAVRLSNRRDMGFLKSPRLRHVFRLVNHRFDAVIAPAHEILAALAEHEGLPASRMLWIANGVDTDRFRPAHPAQREALRQALGLARDQVAFGCVASLYPVKNHAMLLEAFARVHAERPRARLLLVGSGALAGQLAGQAAGLGVADAVRFLGNRPDIHQILPALDAAVLASRSEGMSNAILEAMACGLPMVATAVGGNLQLVRDGATGFLVPSDDHGAMGDAMGRLADEPLLRAGLGQAARRRIESEFSLAGMVDAYDRLYQRLAGVA
ncbi:glycosyltransferase [Marilutibacter spongiae]|uniref:Glycosyltransferase n=1 Tax=Marilutibacter spongiae TaxID=2025720 RepID=A0A7W3Y611_9GAMM|nr:glycosyltransferase [Lysobacter spongiae]MBB1060614.1 glycosyltransferase [Lysobacter spongiae]